MPVCLVGIAVEEEESSSDEEKARPLSDLTEVEENFIYVFIEKGVEIFFPYRSFELDDFYEALDCNGEWRTTEDAPWALPPSFWAWTARWLASEENNAEQRADACAAFAYGEVWRKVLRDVSKVSDNSQLMQELGSSILYALLRLSEERSTMLRSETRSSAFFHGMLASGVSSGDDDDCDRPRSPRPEVIRDLAWALVEYTIHDDPDTELKERRLLPHMFAYVTPDKQDSTLLAAFRLLSNWMRGQIPLKILADKKNLPEETLNHFYRNMPCHILFAIQTESQFLQASKSRREDLDFDFVGGYEAMTGGVRDGSDQVMPMTVLMKVITCGWKAASAFVVENVKKFKTFDMTRRGGNDAVHLITQRGWKDVAKRCAERIGELRRELGGVIDLDASQGSDNVNSALRKVVNDNSHGGSLTRGLPNSAPSSVKLIEGKLTNLLG